MEHEPNIQPAPRKPFEIYGLTEKEALFWRVDKARVNEIINDDQTLIHEIKNSSNNYGEFLFVSTSRPGNRGRICMTFFGLGYHEYRERWVTNEWFWYQANAYPDLLRQKLEKDEAREILAERLEQIKPDIRQDTQTVSRQTVRNAGRFD